MTDLGEAVDAGAVGLGDDADRPALLEDDGCAVRALGQQREGVADGVVRIQHDRGLEDGVACLTQATTSATTSSGMSCGSTLSPPRRAIVSAIRRPDTAVMLADDDGDRRPRAVGGREVHVVARDDRRPTTAP